MNVYRDDREALMLLNESLECDVKELTRTNNELRQRNATLELIARELLQGEQCDVLSQRISELERENIALIRENSLLREDPRASAAMQLARWESMHCQARAELKKTYRQLRYVGICFFVSVVTMVLGKLLG
jgi:hypothetical protein